MTDSHTNIPIELDITTSPKRLGLHRIMALSRSSRSLALSNRLKLADLLYALRLLCQYGDDTDMQISGHLVRPDSSSMVPDSILSN